MLPACMCHTDARSSSGRLISLTLISVQAQQSRAPWQRSAQTSGRVSRPPPTASYRRRAASVRVRALQHSPAARMLWQCLCERGGKHAAARLLGVCASQSASAAVRSATAHASITCTMQSCAQRRIVVHRLLSCLLRPSLLVSTVLSLSLVVQVTASYVGNAVPMACAI